MVSVHMQGGGCGGGKAIERSYKLLMLLSSLLHSWQQRLVLWRKWNTHISSVRFRYWV